MFLFSSRKVPLYNKTLICIVLFGRDVKCVLSSKMLVFMFNQQALSQDSCTMVLLRSRKVLWSEMTVLWMVLFGREWKVLSSVSHKPTLWPELSVNYRVLPHARSAESG